MKLSFAECVAWWVAQMRALAPNGWLREGHQGDAVIIAVDRLEDGAVDFNVLLRRQGRERRVSSAPDQRLPAGLRLPAGAVLSRSLVLPLAVARDLHNMIGFEMERLTPFSADELYWSVSGLKRDRARGKLSLQLSFALRSQVDALRPALTRLRVAPTFIEMPGGRIELAAPAARDRWRDIGLPALCGVLALVCAGLPFLRQQMALDAVNQDIAADTPAAETALALRQRLNTEAAGRAAVAQARRGGDALEVLAMLTSALPDGTWLRDLTLNQGDLTFDGESNNAAQLIGLLSAVPGLHDPSFTAPVTRAGDGNADLFSLHATIAP
jgi:general secretion pathway protein L